MSWPGWPPDLGPALALAGHAGLLQASTQAMRDLFATAACSLAPVDEDGGRLEFVATAGAGAELVVGMRILAGWGIAGWVLASGQPIELRDVARDLRLARDVAERTGHLPRSILALPVEGSQQALGFWRFLTVMVRVTSTLTKASCWSCLPAGGTGSRAGTRVRRPG